MEERAQRFSNITIPSCDREQVTVPVRFSALLTVNGNG